MSSTISHGGANEDTAEEESNTESNSSQDNIRSDDESLNNKCMDDDAVPDDPSEHQEQVGAANETTPSDTTEQGNSGESPAGEDRSGSTLDPADNMNAEIAHDDSEQQHQQEDTAASQGDENSVEVAANIKEFLDKHEGWRICTAILKQETAGEPQGRPMILQAMKKSKQVELHSLKTESRNGQVGTVVGYSIGKDRFAVKVDDNDFALRAKNLRVVEPTDDDSSKDDAGTNQVPLSVDNLVEALFRPGMLFLGNIHIPGLTGQRQEYRLVVSSTSTEDEMGRPTGILARHKAYDDEQFVWIKVDKSNPDADDMKLSIRYADGETQCNGTWNMEKAQFEGTVRQLLPTEDGGSIYYAQDQVTHTFTLSPTTSLYPNGIASSHDTEHGGDADDDGTRERRWEQDLVSPATKSIAELRHEADQLSFELVHQFRNVSSCLGAFTMDRIQGVLFNIVDQLMTQTAWRELLVADSLSAEKSCASLRRWAELLDSLSFVSVEERTDILASLQEKGVTRAFAHKESDELKEGARDLFEAWRVFSAITRSNNRPDAEDMTRILVMCTRLERNFTRFDEALRRAEVRLTDAAIRRWMVSQSNQTGDRDESLCTICHVELEEEEADDDSNILCLPCSHSFHDDCLREWLHHHSQCPVCRLELQS